MLAAVDAFGEWQFRAAITLLSPRYATRVPHSGHRSGLARRS
jgi:hypothetical protein